MSKYNTFLVVFIISVIAFIFFMVFYLNAILVFVFHASEHVNPNPLEVVTTIFTPTVVLSAIILGFTSLLYRVLGIVHVAKSNTVSDGEKALWIVGFVFMGFITAIVFLVMAKGKKFVE